MKTKITLPWTSSCCITTNVMLSSLSLSYHWLKLSSIYSSYVIVCCVFSEIC